MSLDSGRAPDATGRTAVTSDILEPNLPACQSWLRRLSTVISSRTRTESARSKKAGGLCFLLSSIGWEIVGEVEASIVLVVVEKVWEKFYGRKGVRKGRRVRNRDRGKEG